MRWRMLPLFMVFVGMAHFNRISITVAGAEQIIPGGVLSAAAMGRVYSMFLLVYTLCMLPGGWFIDRFGPRRAWLVVVLGSVVLGAATGLAGLEFTDALALYVALLVVRGIMGLTNAPLHPTAARLVGNWFPRHEADLANGSINCTALVFIAGTYVVFGFMMDRVGWPMAFLFSAGVTLVLAVFWLAIGADYPPHAWKAPPQPATEASIALPDQPWRRMLTDRGLLCLTLSYGAQGYFQYLVFYWAQHYFANELHLSPDKSRLYTSIVTLANGFGMVLGGWLSDMQRRRFGAGRSANIIPMTGLALGGVAFLVGLFVEGEAAVVLFFALAMGFAGLSEGPFWSTAVHIGGSYGGTAAAILNTGGNGGGLLAPAFTPIIGAWLGWKASLGVGGLMCLVAAVLWFGVQARASEPVPELAKEEAS